MTQRTHYTAQCVKPKSIRTRAQMCADTFHKRPESQLYRAARDGRIA